MKTPVTQVLTRLVKTKNYYMLLHISHIFQLFEYQPLPKPVATCLMTELMCEDNIKTLRGDPLSTMLSIDIAEINVACAASRRYNKVPNLGLGPKWDQGAKMVPKKSQFYFQVPNF